MSNTIDDLITVVIPTSVIPSHPSTYIIDETIESVRHHLPNARIILQIDGLRDEQKDRAKDYNDYKQQMLWYALRLDKNITPIIFSSMHHQTDMLKATIDDIKTPYLLYVEQDAPLRTDRKIDWMLILEQMQSGDYFTVRLYHEEVIPKEHNYLMQGEVKANILPTTQWSQRPHLSYVFYYKDVILPKLKPKTFIEDCFYSTIIEDSKTAGGWYRHRLGIYHPKGGLQRSYHTDGRAGGRKYTSDDEAWGLV